MSTSHRSTLYRSLWVALLLALVPALATAQDAPLPTVKDVVEHFDDLYRSSSSHSKLKMEIVTANWSRTLEMEAWSKGDDLALIVIRAPAKEAGTATLRTEEGLWNYAPRADRMMRIPSGLLSDGWMGSHFTNDDLMRESSWVDDYDTTLAWVEEGGQRYLRSTAIPKPDAAVVYTKVVNTMTAEGWLPVRADFYDGDELVRTINYKNIKDFGGRTLPAVMELVPLDAPDEKTAIEYMELDFDVKVDKSVFTARGLRKAAQR